MAARRFRRRFPRMTRGSRKKALWTANVAYTDTEAASTQFARNIVTTADYQLASTLEPSAATLTRLVGSLTVTSLGLASLVHTVAWGVIAIDNDANFTTGAYAPNIAQNLIDEQWMWVGHTMFDTDALEVQKIDFDIRVKRKLQDMKVGLVGVTDGGAGISFAMNMRALLLLG